MAQSDRRAASALRANTLDASAPAPSIALNRTDHTTEPVPVESVEQRPPQTAANGVHSAESHSAPADDSAATDAQLSEAEEKTLRELQERDREVRAHEQAHLAAAGSLAIGGARYTYERGPDQRLYAVGGEVQIDTSEVKGDPQATLRKAQTVRRAALAPANPSAQDRQVAAEAARMAAEAQADIAQEASPATAESSSSSVSENAPSSAGQAIEPLHCAACGGRHADSAHAGLTAYHDNTNLHSESVGTSTSIEYKA